MFSGTHHSTNTENTEVTERVFGSFWLWLGLRFTVKVEFSVPNTNAFGVFGSFRYSVRLLVLSPFCLFFTWLVGRFFPKLT